MDFYRDFEELLQCFNAHRVEYLIVGGYALAFHGAPRYTGDLDVWIKPDASNALRVLAALKDFGFGSLEMSEKDFTNPDRVVQLGVAPVRIDLMMSINGIAWEEAAAQRQPGKYGDIPTFFLSLSDFIKNKQAIGRSKDIADIEALGGTKVPTPPRAKRERKKK